MHPQSGGTYCHPHKSSENFRYRHVNIQVGIDGPTSIGRKSSPKVCNVPDLPVLIVDDEPQVRSLIRAILSKAGFRTLEAANGLKALSTVQVLHGEISILVTDYSMPGLDGCGLARNVKEQFPLIPIILMSSHAHAGACLSVDEFLTKPFAPSVLVSTVHRLLALEEKQCA
jgi:CheY-like chemotaxis protein